jgi:hypothetical protein
MTTEHWFELRITDHPRKMSETLVDFARPLTDQLPADSTAEEMKATMTFAACVWNVVDVQGIRDAVVYLNMKMPRRLRVIPAAKAAALVRKMLARKDELFGDDHRLAMDIDVYREGAELRVKAIGLGPNPDFWNPQSKA